MRFTCSWVLNRANNSSATISSDRRVYDVYTMTESLSSDISLLSTLRQLECELHQPKCRRDRARLLQLLAPDFREFGRSGASYTRKEILDLLPAESEPAQIHAQDFAVNQLADGVVLLTYRSAQINSEGELSRHTNRASIWRHTDSGWQMVFHQALKIIK